MKFELPAAISSTSLSVESLNRFQKRERQILYLHGIAELPSVQVVPDALQFTEPLMIGQQIKRVLQFTNGCKTLPIIVCYQKSPYVEVDNYNVRIPPAKSIQVVVSLTARNMERVSTTITFDLKYHNVPKTDNDKYEVIGKVVVALAYETKVAKKVPLPEINTGITPNYIREVGKFCHNVKFKTPVMKPKATLLKATKLNKNDLIAFPNDLQKSLRPWRGDHRLVLIMLLICAPHLPSFFEIFKSIFEKKGTESIVDFYYL